MINKISSQADLPVEHVPQKRGLSKEHQWKKLCAILNTVYNRSPFYRDKWLSAGVKDWKDIASFSDFASLPFTTREELLLDQENHPPYGKNLTFPLSDYIRWFRTSGSVSSPLNILLTDEDWAANGQNWVDVFCEIGLKPGDSIFIAFSFGPFQGFWNVSKAAEMHRLLMIPGGGMNTLQRLYLILKHKPTALACVPSYAQRMAEVARENNIDLHQSGVRFILTAGEPGPSIPATRSRIESAWGAKAFESYGLTEVGHIAHDCWAQQGMHLQEQDHYVEILDPNTSRPVEKGKVGEVIVTCLNRLGMPAIRYRTGDLVELVDEPCQCGNTSPRLKGGILGRIDGMVTVRGINVYPTSVENCLMSFPQIQEFKVEFYEKQGMQEMRVSIEIDEGQLNGLSVEAIVSQVKQDLRQRLTLRAEILIVPPGSLPRSEGKARRFVKLP